MPYRYPPEFRRKVCRPREGGVSCRIDVRRSSAASSWIRWLLAGRWRLCQLISVCRTGPSTGTARTLLTEALAVLGGHSNAEGETDS